MQVEIQRIAIKCVRDAQDASDSWRFLGDSSVGISRVISPPIWILTLLLTPPITTHELPSNIQVTQPADPRLRRQRTQRTQRTLIKEYTLSYRGLIVMI